MEFNLPKRKYTNSLFSKIFQLIKFLFQVLTIQTILLEIVILNSVDS